MAYLWSDKVTDYYYSNPELDTVAVMWTDPEDKLTREHYIKVDESDEQWRDFVAEVSYEKINERTMVRHEQFREQFREAFRNYAQREDVDFGNSNSTNKFEDVIIDFISEFDNTDADQKEQLFKLKLKIFEQDVVKDSGSNDKFKKAKTFIRKADNPMDALLGYMVFTNDAELKEEGVYIPFK
jgi:hypothetical protein